MIGAVILVVAMVVMLPVALFVAGALWSALLGTTLTAAAGQVSPEPPPATDQRD